jgi:glycosyltransferase involved in cell wall biosynthesis
MKKVLYIVYYYPPIGGSGVQRGVKFSKYLPESGWESIVLTPHPSLVKHPKDYSLLRDVPDGQKIYRSFVLDAGWLYKIFWGLRLPKVVIWLMFRVFIPDSEILWLPFAKQKIKKVMREHKIDLVFISGPPFSPMLLGKWIKDKFKIPYIVSFRDDWSNGQSRLDNPPPKAFCVKERKLEHKALKHADHIVVVNKAYKRDFRALYPDIADNRYTVITNGYDEDDFSNPIHPRDIEKDKLQIVHPGVLFGRRHPGLIWQALVNLVNQGSIDPDKVKVHIYGRNFTSFVFKGWEDNAILQKIVQLHPYLPHQETIKILVQADLLLLFSGPGAKSDAELPGKLFEYLRSGKPILGVINPHGVCAEILERAKSGWIADAEVVGEIEKQLLAIYQRWSEDKLLINPDWEYIRGFERRRLSKALALVFDSVANSRD